MAVEQVNGRVTYLRVQDIEGGYGGVDVDVISRLDNYPGKAFGFKLRNDSNRPAREGMLDLLRDAFTNYWPVTMDYEESGSNPNTKVVFRVWLTKS
jgi:hypothetical protein